MNRVELIGNLGNDPQLIETSDGKQLCVMRVATNETWKTNDGETHRHTEWHRVVVWGSFAQSCAERYRKGSHVRIEGSMRYRTYTDANGETRYSSEVKARNIRGLGGNNRSE